MAAFCVVLTLSSFAEVQPRRRRGRARGDRQCLGRGGSPRVAGQHLRGWGGCGSEGAHKGRSLERESGPGQKRAGAWYLYEN